MFAGKESNRAVTVVSETKFSNWYHAIDLQFKFIMSGRHNNLPLVSVIMNCFNGEKYLRDAIDSVISQTYKNWEIIFWDNKSDDTSKEIALSFDNKIVIKYHSSPELAVIGSGDVLSGFLVSLVGQKKMTPFLAGCAATWLHGDIAKKYGKGLIAEDIINDIIDSFDKLMKRGYLKNHPDDSWVDRNFNPTCVMSDKGQKEIEKKINELREEWDKLVLLYEKKDKEKLREGLNLNRMNFPLMMKGSLCLRCWKCWQS